MMTWPYRDADQGHRLASRRIPVIPDLHPRHQYEVALCIGAPDAPHPYYRGQEPTDEEVDLIVAALEYRMSWYNEGWRQRMSSRPLDTDGGTNTVVLVKLGPNNWAYRRASWTSGPILWPSRNSPLPLRDVLDHALGEAWRASTADSERKDSNGQPA
jgi:hypothetical protein